MTQKHTASLFWDCYSVIGNGTTILFEIMKNSIPILLLFHIMKESTYGTHIHEPREDREARFTGLVQDIVTRGGRCLIPVFALGRAQELLLILGRSF